MYEDHRPRPDARLMQAILDSLKDPVLFADTDHVIRYMNQACYAHYDKAETLLGSSLLDCHNERSCEVIHDVFARMQEGLQEELITDNKKHRIFMRAVRDGEGKLLGYFERYEPPRQDTP